MIDLSTNYLGLTLKNPVMASSSPLSQKIDSVKELEDNGISAIVMYSLFEEQIIRESSMLNEDLERGTNLFAEALDYIPSYGQFSLSGDKYLERLATYKEMVDIPIIASLNGVTVGGWTEYAKLIEEAGADALELNLYDIPTDPTIDGGIIENQHIQLVQTIKEQINIPLAVKISPFYSAIPNFAHKLANAGANSLVLFNRFYQPNIDLENLEIIPVHTYSTSSELLLPLRWVAILYRQVLVDFSITGGVHTGEDVLKSMMAGASVTQLASELLLNGSGAARKIISGMADWMEEHEYSSINQMKGSMSRESAPESDKFTRANYMHVLGSFQ